MLSGSEFLHARMECAAKSNDVDDVFECIRAMQAQGTEVQWQSMQSAARSIASDEESIDGAYYKARRAPLPRAPVPWYTRPAERLPPAPQYHGTRIPPSCSLLA